MIFQSDKPTTFFYVFLSLFLTSSSLFGQTIEKVWETDYGACFNGNTLLESEPHYVETDSSILFFGWADTVSKFFELDKITGNIINCFTVKPPSLLDSVFGDYYYSSFIPIGDGCILGGYVEVNDYNQSYLCKVNHEGNLIWEKYRSYSDTLGFATQTVNKIGNKLIWSYGAKRYEDPISISSMDFFWIDYLDSKTGIVIDSVDFTNSVTSYNSPLLNYLSNSTLKLFQNINTNVYLFDIDSSFNIDTTIFSMKQRIESVWVKGSNSVFFIERDSIKVNGSIVYYINRLDSNLEFKKPIDTIFTLFNNFRSLSFFELNSKPFYLLGMEKTPFADYQYFLIDNNGIVNNFTTFSSFFGAIDLENFSGAPTFMLSRPIFGGQMENFIIDTNGIPIDTLTSPGYFNMSYNNSSDSTYFAIISGNVTKFRIAPDTTTGVWNYAPNSPISLFPNPVKNHSILSFSNPISTISVFNSTGQMVKSTGSTPIRSIEIDLPPGIYLMHYDFENESFTETLVVE